MSKKRRRRNPETVAAALENPKTKGFIHSAVSFLVVSAARSLIGQAAVLGIKSTAMSGGLGAFKKLDSLGRK
jgi:hypothetical protein